MTAPTITLSNGVEMPQLGLGTWPMDDNEAARSVVAAIERGYRLFDTAENYRNERGVGQGVRNSGIDRAEVFVTTKFNVKWHGIDEVRQAANESIERLGLDYIDLLLIHWPNPQQDRYVDAWRGMLKLMDEGLVKSAGVSNFKPAHIERLIEATGVAPHVNQVQLSPWITRSDAVAYHAGHGIVTETWAPIAKGADLLAAPAVASIAKAHGRTPAQVVLRWHVQQGFVPIPKTSNPERMTENLDVFDFELTAQEMQALAALDRGGAGAVDSDGMGH